MSCPKTGSCPYSLKCVSGDQWVEKSGPWSFRTSGGGHALGGIRSHQPAQPHFIEPRPLAHATRMASAGGATSTSWLQVMPRQAYFCRRSDATPHVTFKVVSEQLNIANRYEPSRHGRSNSVWHSSRVCAARQDLTKIRHAVLISGGGGGWFRRDVRSQMKSRCWDPYL